MTQEEKFKLRDKLHSEIVRHVTRLTMKHDGDFDVVLYNPICTTDPSGAKVNIIGIDGVTCRLITDVSYGFRVDYPRLAMEELEVLHNEVFSLNYCITSYQLFT